MKYAEVAYDIDEFDDDEILREAESRGIVNSIIGKSDITESIAAYQRGNISEAVLLLEREYPELYGLHKYLTISR
jgi:hypothetical protein